MSIMLQNMKNKNEECKIETSVQHFIMMDLYDDDATIMTSVSQDTTIPPHSRSISNFKETENSK